MRRSLLLLVGLLNIQLWAQGIPASKPPLDPIYEGAEREVQRTLTSLQEQHLREQARGFMHPKLLRGDPSKPHLCLTFDDGPHPTWTLALLDILREHKVRATFFVVGHQVARFPELLKAIAAGGHQVANHTYHHRNLTHLSDEEVAAELLSCDEVTFPLTGRHMHTYRPPGGQYDRRVADVAADLGYSLILWTDDPGDYAHPDVKLLEKRTLDNIENGGVILLHDGIAQTLLILPELLEHLKARGFQFLTVDQMLAEQPPQKWFSLPPGPKPSPIRRPGPVPQTGLL